MNQPPCVDAFPQSIVAVATAVPAFVGYTEKADNQGQSLAHKPCRITSMDEFTRLYGGAPRHEFSIAAAASEPDFTDASGKPYALLQLDGGHLLHHSLVLFFENGGGPCYIVSVGTHEDGIRAEDLNAGIDALEREQEPTLLVIPDAVKLKDEASCIAVQNAALAHCGSRMRNRLAILDLYRGNQPRNHPAGDPVSAFREHLGTEGRAYAAAYYPWLETNVVTADEVTLSNVPSADPLHGFALTAARRKVNLLPPSAAMAGVYTSVDNLRGVWKAPANVALNGVIAPAVNISAEEQQDLNVCASGLSINAIRTFVGEGVLVWGARTLDGNSQDWRYLNVRRTMIFLEQSIELAVRAYVFEPNVANTWITVKSMIRNFLDGVWKQGGLAGATPDEAFNVSCGLGETMTPDDILAGYLRITVLVAISRPGEFIEFTFQQQMQAS